ncbi:metal-dependent hydrolase [Motiliproteus sediminis]|uniref:metal-dependent hydrolase n=1 Tax=Motiliproteus sediminis TaxID=1468178 RepID=UPI001FE4010A|nr:metal-dependent hydrolase [Motiliproteus sediminis]
MDPLTQGALGAALPQSVAPRREVVIATAGGFLAGMAPDLDVFIRSATDPLLYFEYHRQFTHSLIFIPLGGLIVASLLWLLGRRWWTIGFGRLVLLCALGYGTHGLLDAMTSYGTLLLWPFSDHRFAFSFVSVFDPLVTVPLVILVAVGLWRRQPVFARLGLVWVAVYLSVGAIQQQRALSVAMDLADERGHQPLRMIAKPTFGNQLVWKTIYETRDAYYVDAVRTGLNVMVYEGNSARRLTPDSIPTWLDTDSQQAKDLARFSKFSNGFLAITPYDPLWIIDVRYSMVPNRADGIWSVRLNPDAGPDDHIITDAVRSDPRQGMAILWSMIKGTY